MAVASAPLPLLPLRPRPPAGRAVVDALLASPAGAYHILAVTRSAASGSAQALAKLPNTTVLEGSFDDPAKLFANAGRKVDSAFLVTIAGDHALEERQGKVRRATGHSRRHLPL
jgi:hypothetical protein